MVGTINAGDQGWGGNGKTVTVNGTWQRFSVSNSNQNGLSRLYLQMGGGLSLLAGIQIWGTQVVVDSNPDPYTPTPPTGTVSNSATGRGGYTGRTG